MLTQEHYQLLFLFGVLILFAIDLLKGLLWTHAKFNLL